VASAVATIIGFGSATILIPFAGLVIDLKAAIVLVGFFHLFSNLSRLGMLRQSLNNRLFLTYGSPSVLAALGGAWLFYRLEVRLIAMAFAVFLIVFALHSLLNPRWSVPDTTPVLVSGGLLSGFVSGVIGVGGAVRSMFLIATGIDKEAYVATSAAIAVVVDMTRLPIYVVGGDVEASYYYYIAPLVVIALLGAVVGRRLLRRLPGVWVRRLVVVALMGVAIKMLVAP
jgi:hypothetical protein